MSEFIIRFSLRNKIWVGLLVCSLAAGGLYSLNQLPIDAVPDITNNQVQIITTTPSLAPQEMEQFVTFPVEMAMANLQGVTEMRSVSKYGLSVVTVVFEDRVPVLDARQLVAEQIRQASEHIPAGYGTPEMMPITTGLGEIFQFTLQVDPAYTDTYDAMELRTIQDWIVKRYLAGIPGIVEISSFGGYLKQYEVALDPERLRAVDVSLTEVYDALSANNQNAGGSYIEKGPNAYYIRTEGILTHAETIGNIQVKLAGQTPVLIRDIGEVRLGHMPRYGAMTQDGKGEAVGGITLMYKGANSNQVITRVKERLERVGQVLPPGIRLEPFLDRADLVGRTIRTVSLNLAEGGLIVVFVLVLLLGNWRAGLIVASVIPLSMLFAFICMRIFGVSANLMSLGAIDFGLVVDGAVIVVEATVHRLSRRLQGQVFDQAEMDQAAGDAALGIRKSAGFPEVIILIVYLPILTLSGIEGKMFLPMAQTVSFAILGGLLLSVTYVPVASALFLKKRASSGGNISERLLNWLRKGYLPLLEKALRSPGRVIATAAAATMVALFLYTRMGGEFIPDLEEGDLAMQMTIPAGSALSQTIATSTRAEQILLSQFPEVKHVVSKIGSAEIPTDPMSVEDADVMIILHDPQGWPAPKSREQLSDEMKAALEAIPEAAFEFSQPIQLRFNELMTGAKSDIAVKIFGEDLALLAELGNQATAVIRTVPGAADVKLEVTEGFPQITVRYDRMQLARHGLSIAEVNRSVEAAFAGLKAGVVFEGEKRFDLVARLHPSHRTSIESLRQLPVRGGAGYLLPLSELAAITLEEGPMQISREDGKRRIAIGVNVRSRDVESLVREMEERLRKEVQLPPGYAFSFGGEFQNLQSAKERLAIAVPLALAMIFLLLFLTFHSVKLTLIIFTAVPMAAIGGVVALYLRDMPFSISAGIGFIALFGVAVLNGVVLIGHYAALKNEGMSDPRQRVLVGSGARLRPVIMTAAVASLGFLPMALSASAGAEVQRPLATVVIGGLVSSTLLTLFVAPLLYFLLEKPRSPGKKGGKRQAAFACLLLLGAVGLPVVGQPVRLLTLEAAEQEALESHMGIQRSKAESEAARRAIRTGWDLPRASVELQRGQINTLFRDNAWAAWQPLGNPLEMNARRLSLTRAWESMKVNEAVQANLARYQVRALYQTWGFVISRQVLLDAMANDLGEAARIAALRYETGETSLVAKSAVTARWREAQALAAAEAAFLQTLRIRLAVLLYADSPAEPVVELPWGPLLAAATEPVSPPVLDRYAAGQALAQQAVRERKAALAPAIRAGVFTQQIERVNGFNGFMVGLEAPLVFRADKARIAVAQSEASLAGQETEWAQFRLNTLRAEIAAARDALAIRLNYFEETGLPEASLQITQGRLLWQAGEIAYFEFLALVQEAYRMRLQYLDVVHDFNQTLLEFQFVPAFD